MGFFLGDTETDQRADDSTGGRSNDSPGGDARWILDTVGQHEIVARSQARADVGKGSHTLENRIRRGSVAVYPLGSAVFFEAIVDVGDDPRDQLPLAGFNRIFTSRYYAIYGNC